MTVQYQDMLEHVIINGVEHEDRTGTGTKTVFGYQARFDLTKGFPLLTTKDMGELFPKIFHELMWFVKGEINIRYLLDRNVNIWNADAYRWFNEQNPEANLTRKQFIDLVKTDDAFAKEWGDLGRIYGKQWSDFGGHLGHDLITGEAKYVKGINQVEWLINEIKTNPNSRRLIISAWNAYDMDDMALPPCHVLVQFRVMNGKLHAQLYQRSGDLFLGVPFNIASYSLLVHMIAFLTDLEVGEFVHTFGDLHIYNNHIEQVTEQLKRNPYPMARLYVKNRAGINSITDFELSDFELVGYKSHEVLTGEVSVG